MSRKMTGLGIARHFLGLRRRIPSATGGNWPRQERLYCQLVFGDGTVGYGEAAPHPIYGPRIDQLEVEIRQAQDFLHAPTWPSALTLATLDAWSRTSGLPLWNALGWPPPAADGYRTLLSYGGVSPELICNEIASESPGAVKLKLSGADTDLLVVREISNAFHLPLVLDINGAWEWEKAVHFLKILEKEDLQLLWIEQPCSPRILRTKLPTTIPIFADEAVADPAFDWDCYDGIVLKPARLGLLPCARLGRLAKDRGKATTLGCHLQSSLLTSASLCLGAFISQEWVDLDSAMLVKDDPFQPPPLDRAAGRIRLSEGIGLATALTTDLSWRT